MQRYTGAGHNAGFGGGVPGRGVVAGGREKGRPEPSSFHGANYPLNSRRQPQVAPYKLKCDKEPLNAKLGAPDFYPQTSNCPEETLTKEYVQSGYKDTVEGIEEAREIVLSHIPYFCKQNIAMKCKEALKKRFRAINESRAQKRKAGQVYGVPLSGSLLTKPGMYPEQMHSNEDTRRKWIEALSQPNRRLLSLAEHIPRGFRRKSLFNYLIRYNVPLLRASWLVKVTYLNQVQLPSDDISSVGPDNLRAHHWTKDVVEYSQQLLDELCSKNGFSAPPSSQEQSLPYLIAGDNLTKLKTGVSPAGADFQEPSLYFKWSYMVRIIQWHLMEQLLVPSLLIEWVFNQLQERDSAKVLEFLLPIVLALVDTITLSQTHIHILVEILIQRISDASPGSLSVKNNPKRSFITPALVDLLQHLILAVPDAFVSLDCFPLPSIVAPDVYSKGALLKITGGGRIVSSRRQNASPHFSCGYAICSVQRRASDLSSVANPNLQVRGSANIVQALDKALVTGNLRAAYTSVFNCLSDTLMEETWIKEVSPCLLSSLMWMGAVELSLVCSVFFICEWATCNFRDCRTSQCQNVKFSGSKDFSQVYMAISLLKNKMDEISNLSSSKSSSQLAMNNHLKSSTQNHSSMKVTAMQNASGFRDNTNSIDENNKKDIFSSPGPLHDIIVCWLDQHEISDASEFKSVDVFMMELIRNGIFYPQTYVRQLIVSGITNWNDTLFGLERKTRHYKILKHLPGFCLFDILEDARIAEDQVLYEIVSAYSSERRLVLSELSSGLDVNVERRVPLSSCLHKQTDLQMDSSDDNHGRVIDQVEEAKLMISGLLNLGYSTLLIESGREEVKRNQKGQTGLIDSEDDSSYAKTGCKDSTRTKRQKLDKNMFPFQGFPLVQSDEEEFWWVKKEHKNDLFTVETIQQSVKQTNGVKATVVQNTQNLAQLAAARIDASQGASTSHMCDNKLSCPHHKPGTDSDILKDVDQMSMLTLAEVGKSLKRLRLLERRSISIWLLKSIKELIEGDETKLSKPNNSISAFTVQHSGKIASRWRFGEDDLLSVLYIMDTCCDFLSSVRLLIWLLSKVHPERSTSGQAGRGVMQPKHKENQLFHLPEAFLFSSLLRYENILLATGLLPEVLSVSMDVHKSASEELDMHVHQKLNINAGVLPSMKEIVQRQTEEVLCNLKEKNTTAQKSPSYSKKEDSYQTAHGVVLGLADCIRQNGGANPDGDHSLVVSAVSAIVGNAGNAIAKHLDILGSNYPGVTSSNSSNLIRHTLDVHINSLSLLKETLGERFSRIFEISLAVEASSAVAASFAPPKAHHSQQSSETHDACGNHANDVPGNPTKGFNVKTEKVAAAVSALVVGAIIHGVVSLERMVVVLRLKEGLDILHFLRISKGSSNGVTHSIGNFKTDSSTEVLVHWFKILIGNCKTVYNGVIAEILGDSYVLAFSRLQRTLPLGMVLPPAYSIFAMVLWQPYLYETNTLNHEDIQLYQSLLGVVSDITRHQPFRDVCFRNMHLFYDLLAADVGDLEFAAIIELRSPDECLKALSPLRARLFLNALLDCEIPVTMRDDGTDALEPGCEEVSTKNDVKFPERLLEILNVLQPAKFHWQWVELRLLLDEQSLIEKPKTMPYVKALRSLSPNAENFTLSEREKGLTEIILSRLLVRPDAAPLYSELIHLLGKLQESFVMGIKWFLQGQDVLLGNNSVRQQLVNLTQRKGFPMKTQFWKPWGWSKLVRYANANKSSKRKLEVASVEEREVNGLIDSRKSSTSNSQNVVRNPEARGSTQKYLTQEALAELVLPCIDRSSTEFRFVFASDLIKHMGVISEHIKAAVWNGIKLTSSNHSGNEGFSKPNGRKGIYSSSPNIGKHSPVPNDSTIPSASALRSSIWLRLQFIIRLLPVIIADSNMRQTLASSILSLVGTRVVYEDADSLEPYLDVLFDCPSESLFDRLLCVLHALLGSSRPSWLKTKPGSKPAVKFSRDLSEIDKEVVKSLQCALDCMELPATIRRRIQVAMPILPSSRLSSITCSPPLLSSAALLPFHCSTSTAEPHQQFPLSWIPTNLSSRCKVELPSQDPNMEIDPWTLLEDGTNCPNANSGSNSTNGVTGDHTNLKACSWLKGSVRVRRTDLTYIGSLDEDS
ncbi:mediator of RNA polymerase II transcription subunit 12-like isoform X2 [Oryza brachyantha]|uniref:mediator of RNA polymerase II transcription subunit 12-like isoform X2 n=1 Tax=Oryza brachyantha TaxID=4533 RepID=UPI001ADD1454|nr:mediator of RNA polymerase II transcription subunit 12-like isoform X2 [Oryza brachyantha]